MVDVTDQSEGAVHAGASVAPRSWWWQLWGTLLTLVVIDVLILLLGPLLWGGGNWSGATLKFSLAIMVGVDLMLVIANGWRLIRRTRVGIRPPRI
jgi:hypothetical protein